MLLLSTKVGYTRLATLDDHNSAVTAVTFASKDSRMITCSADGTVAFRDLREDGDTADDYCQKAKVPGSGALYHMDIEATGRFMA